MTSNPSDHPIAEGADPWSNRIPSTQYGGQQFGRFLATFRDLEDVVTSVNPPPAEWAEADEAARRLIERLRPWVVGEKQQPAGTRMDLPGRGHPFLLPFVPSESTDAIVRGRVTFRYFHLGGNGAAHGGALPLLFDEILGRLANAGGRPTARTAYLHVNYRRITPIDVELHLDATFDRQEGRKRWLSGRLRDGDTVLADAEGLFIQLLPGQP
jgi:acyl-coenzyme A thioesterase PaaI-like protein